MHAHTPSAPMIHTSDACGLKSDPTGESAIRCEVLPPKSGVGRGGSAVAVTATSCPRTPAEVLLPAIMISLTSILLSAITNRKWLSRHFDCFEHRVDYLANLDAFHLEI